MSELIDAGYRDPWDERDDIPDDPPTREEYDPTIRELGSEQLKRLLELGAGLDQVLARDELQRRAGAGYQPSLLGPAEQLATRRSPPR